MTATNGAPASSAPSGSEDNAEEEKEMPPLSRPLKLALMTMILGGFLDYVGYLAIMPSLIFYVREQIGRAHV